MLLKQIDKHYHASIQQINRWQKYMMELYKQIWVVNNCILLEDRL